MCRLRPAMPTLAIPKVTTRSQKVGARSASARVHDLSVLRFCDCALDGGCLMRRIAIRAKPHVFRSSAYEDKRRRRDQERRDDAEYGPGAAPADQHKQGCGNQRNTELGYACAQVGDAHRSAALAHEPLCDRYVDDQR